MFRHECPPGRGYVERDPIRLGEVAGVREGLGGGVREVVIGRSLASVLEGEGPGAAGAGRGRLRVVPGSGKVALDEPEVPVRLLSRAHAVIEVEPATGGQEVGPSSAAGVSFRLKPRSHVNGTYVNGELVEDRDDGVLLRDGDRVSFGGPPGTFLFESPSTGMDVELDNPFVFVFVEDAEGEEERATEAETEAETEVLARSPAAQRRGGSVALGKRKAEEEAEEEVGSTVDKDWVKEEESPRDVIDVEQIISQATPTPSGKKAPGVVDLTDADEAATQSAEKWARGTPRHCAVPDVEVVTFDAFPGGFGGGSGASPAASPVGFALTNSLRACHSRA